MQFSLENQTATLSVGEFANFALGPQESGGGPQGLWRAQLGQHWHNELRTRTEREFTTDGVLQPGVAFEVPIEGALVHRGWTITLQGRIDQQIGPLLREIKSVTRPLPAAEADLRAAYPAYFLQLATYGALKRVRPLNSQPSTLNQSALRAELVFVEAGTGVVQTLTLTPFDEALVSHQLDALVVFLNLRRQATARRRALQFSSPFTTLRPGQETIQQDLASAFDSGSQLSTLLPGDGQDKHWAGSSQQQRSSQPPRILLFEAPTGYGKTGCVLEFALGQLKAGRYSRLIWLTGKATGQLQVVHTLRQMTAPDLSLATSPLSLAATSVAAWQIRNKSEHCVNHTFHCVRDGCDYLREAAERWPQSGLAKFYLDDAQPHDLDTLRAAGREARICPYEITRTALAFNDVWIGDFNYVFSPDNRTLFFNQPGFDPADTLLVIDEAHNLPSRAAGARSHEVHDTDARLLLAELDHLQAPAPLVLALDEWTRLLGSLQPQDSLDPTLEYEIHDLVAKLAGLVATQSLDYEALGPHHCETLWQFAALDNFLTDTQLTKLLWVPRPGELAFTCIDAAPAIGETLRSFGGAILMSATLQPYESIATACGLENTCGRELAPTSYATLQAPTPWRAGAYDIAVDLRVETTFRQRTAHHGTTAATIEALCAAAAAQISNAKSLNAASQLSTLNSQLCSAVAVFFPSYAYAEAIRQSLERNGSVLRVALQPRLPDLAAQNAWVEENLVLADALFLVLGSSFAEGIDLLGGRVSHAMVVSPSLPEVNAVQKARSEALAGLGREAAFQRVYQIPGLQKVNQALGRLVRAPGHHAKVLLHCRRFADPSYAQLLARDYQFYREIATDTDLATWLN